MVDRDGIKKRVETYAPYPKEDPFAEGMKWGLICNVASGVFMLLAGNWYGGQPAVAAMIVTALGFCIPYFRLKSQQNKHHSEVARETMAAYAEEKRRESQSE